MTKTRQYALRYFLVHLRVGYLSNTGGEEVDYPLVRDGYHALSIDLNDPVAHPHAAPLCYSSPQQTADLERSN